MKFNGLEITLEKVPLGFIARLGGCSGSGSTWPEAVGGLLAMHPELFGVTRISYERTPLTIDYRLRHSLEEEIIHGKRD